MMKTRTKVIAKDGVSRLVETRGKVSLRDAAAVAEAFDGWGFARAVDAGERYWRTVPSEARPKGLTKPWYAQRIIADLDWLHGVVDRARQGQVTAASVEHSILVALRLGASLEDAAWRFNLGDDVKLGRQVRVGRQRGGKARGQQKAREARKDDAKIAMLLRRYDLSDELKFDYPRSPVRYIRDQTNLPTKKIERVLRRLESRTRQ